MSKQDLKDLETLQGLIRGGILSGDKIKSVVADWDNPATTVTADACVKISTACQRLECSREQIKLLANAGYLQRFYARPGSRRACGITLSSLTAYIASGADRRPRIAMRKTA